MPSVFHNNFIYCLTAFAFIKVVHRGVIPWFSMVTKLSTSSCTMGEENRCLRLCFCIVCFLLSSYVSFSQQGKCALKVQPREYCHFLGSFKTLEVPEEFHKVYILCNDFQETAFHSHPSGLNQVYVEASQQYAMSLEKAAMTYICRLTAASTGS